jgi:long-chain acyl-CoA synthetase
MTRGNLTSLFGEFQRYGRDIAVVQRRGYRREIWTYEKLANMALACALDLKERGIRTGDRVLLWGPNSAEWMAAFWGCLMRGAVTVPMDDAATEEFAARVAREAAIKLAISAREKPVLDAAVPRLVLEELADTTQPSLRDASQRFPGQLKESIAESLADEPLGRNHITQILFTSGTTAEPRGVVLTHGNFLANLEPLERGIQEYRKYERWFHPLRFVSLVPLSHVFGQFMTLFVPPLLGAAVIFEPSNNPSNILRTIKRERATALIAVPRMLDALRHAIEREMETHGWREWFERAFEAAKGKKFLRRVWMFRRIHRRFGWKFWAFISGGAALSGESEDFFKRLGYAVVQGYGMTETASLISLNHPFRAAQGSLGKVLPGREFRLAEDGEILVRGENVAAGYWEAGTLRPSDEKGWLRTGDIGELDAEGNLRFRGRKKNVIVTPAGLNVYPEDLEAALRKQPGVRDCVVVPMERGGNAEPCAVLLLEGDEQSEAGVASIVQSANETLAEYQRMRTWLRWPEADFPRTSTGKPRLNRVVECAREILSGSGRTGAEASGWRASGNALGEMVQRFSRSSGEGAKLEKELNLSSLDRVELMSALEERFQVELSETAFAEARTVADVAHLLTQPVAHRAQYNYPRWTQRWPARWIRLGVYYALVWPATQILAHPKIAGRNNLQRVRGPLLILSNHVTRRADIGLILLALPLRFRHRLAIAMGGETLQKMRRPPREWLVAKRWAYQLGYWLVTLLFNVFPLPQLSGFRESFRFAGESADRGYSILVFPEGVVNESETGGMAPFQEGIGLLAENLGLPVLPMRLEGVWKMKREHRRLAHAGEVTVRIGAPVNFPPRTSPKEITGALEKLVRGM